MWGRAVSLKSFTRSGHNEPAHPMVMVMVAGAGQNELHETTE
jgi:hypothetical protein